MGRGRQRAKQRKVARDLKYYSPKTDFSALARELSSAGGRENTSWDSADAYEDEMESTTEQNDADYSDEYAAYAEYAAKYGDDAES